MACHRCEEKRRQALEAAARGDAAGTVQAIREGADIIWNKVRSPQAYDERQRIIEQWRRSQIYNRSQR